MDKHYIVYGVTLIVLLLQVCGVEAQTLPFELQVGKPFTYVPDELVPDSVSDDAARRETMRKEVFGNREVRYIWRIYWHYELIDTSADTIRVDLIRDPGVVETVTFAHTFKSNYVNIPAYQSILGSNCVEYPYASLSISFYDETKDEDRPGSSDSSWIGSVKHAPVGYLFREGRRGQRRWGYFVQFVDSISHPPVKVSTKDLLKVEAPRVFPNPANDRVSFELPPGWGGTPGELVFYSTSGSRVRTEQTVWVGDGARHDIDISTLAAGTYMVNVRQNSSREWTSFTFTKL